jgi:hypothetical protein
VGQTLGRNRTILGFESMSGQIRPHALDGPFDTDAFEIVCPHSDKTFPDSIGSHELHVGEGGKIGGQGSGGR